MKIKSIRKIEIPKNTTTYNLEVADNNNYYASGILVSNCHLAKADELKGIIRHCSNAKYRLGFSGTLPDKEAELYGVLSYLGPKVLEVETQELIKQGYISDLKINALHIEYPDKDEYKDKNLSWSDMKKKIIKDPRRLGLIKKICESTEKNILMLVSFVQTEGLVLHKYLKETFPDRNVHFIHGEIPVTKREKIRKSADQQNGMIIIATYGVFKLGINIKNLHTIILASPLISKISNLQSIGRGLRILPNKKLIVYDLIDHVRYLLSQGKKRAKIWAQEKFQVKSYKLPN